MPKRSIIPVFVPHLGCPNDCVFCNQRRISGALTPATADTVHQAVEYALHNIPTDRERELAFYGGSFTAISAEEQESLLGAAYDHIKSGEIAAIRLSTRPDCIDGAVLDRLKRYGVETVELGVQSMCPDVLAASNRGHTAEDAENSAKAVKNAGFKLILQMMTGLPLDTPEKSEYTARRLCDLHPDGVRIYPTVIIKDTRLYDMWQSGEYREHTVDDAAELCARLLDIFDGAGIPVIRLGLNPTDELSSGSAAGGAYHPAFGEIVMSKRYLMKAESLLADHKSNTVTLGVAKGEMSKMIGQNRRNIDALRAKFNLEDIKIRETDINKGEIVILRL